MLGASLTVAEPPAPNYMFNSYDNQFDDGHGQSNKGYMRNSMNSLTSNTILSIIRSINLKPNVLDKVAGDKAKVTIIQTLRRQLLSKK